MISGHISSIGDIEVDGEKVTGIFVECDREQFQFHVRGSSFLGLHFSNNHKGLKAQGGTVVKNLTAFAVASADMVADGMEVEGLDGGPVMVLDFEESCGRVEEKRLDVGGAEEAAEAGLYRDVALEEAAEIDEMEWLYCMGVI
jgi:hypothetical protein